MPSVRIGKDVETDHIITLTDEERCSGMYILGRSGFGKTVLMKKIIAQDMDNGHGVFFLDPHGDAVEDLLTRIPSHRQNDVIVLDPRDSEYAFGLNLLACPDVTSMVAREDTFDQAYDLFAKLFANPQLGRLDVLLDKYLRNSFYPLLVANKGYALSEIPFLLQERPFRDHLLRHPLFATEHREVARFWHTEFAGLEERDKRHEIDSTLNRLGSFTRRFVRDIVGQSETSLTFPDIMDSGKILFVKLSASLAEEQRRIIGTLLISSLVHAVLQRERLPEGQRRHFCIFVDEFQNFAFHNLATSNDFEVLFTQARKYAVATTIAHQERFGQFADNKRIAGATDAAVIKLFFRPTPHDAREQAAEFTTVTKTTETRLEPELVISMEPFWDLLKRGHANPRIQKFVNTYLWPIAKHLEYRRAELEKEKLKRTGFSDEATLNRDEASLSQADEREEGYTHARRTAIDRTRAAIERTRNAHLQLRDKNEELVNLHTWFQHSVKRIDDANEFLRTLMRDGDALEEGNEPLALFVKNMLADIANCYYLQHGSGFDHQSPILKFYIDIQFGNREKPRIIPAYLAHKYYPQQLEAVYMEQYKEFAEKWHKEAFANAVKYWGSRASVETVAKLMQEELLFYRQSKVFIHIGEAAITTKGYYQSGKTGLREYVAGWACPLPDLPARVFSETEREALIEQCEKIIEADIQAGLTVKTLFQIIDDVVGFCYHLQKPENHIKVASGQYVEKQVHVRAVHDMTDETAQALLDLQPHTAYVRSSGSKGKIRTLEIDWTTGGHLVDVSGSARNKAIDQKILKRRSEIEKEIRERQEGWRRGGNDPTPPTSSGGNSPPSLPSGGAGKDREWPPPTHYTSEEPPPGNSAVAQSGTQTDDRGEEKGQTGKLLDFASYLQKREANTSGTPLTPRALSADRQYTTSDDPYPSRQSPVPDLQTRQRPELEFLSLRFFESGNDIPRRGQRQYNTHFPQSTARYIYYELEMRRAQKGERLTYQVMDRYYYPDGSFLGTREYDDEVTSESERWNSVSSQGWDEAIRWTPGTYRVEILIDGVEFARGSFTITDDRNEQPVTAHLRFESLCFYESGTGKLTDRQYNTHFPQSTTRYIYYELKVKILQKRAHKTYQISARYYSPDGDSWAYLQSDLVVELEDEWTYPSWGTGWAQSGRWTPGVYRVEILIDGVEFAEGSFTITDDRNELTSGAQLVSTNLEFESLRFFESGKGLLPSEQRKFRTYFPHQRTRFINFDLILKNLHREDDQTYKLIARYYNSQGTHLQDVPKDLVIKSESGWHEQCGGWNGAGHWNPDTYRVVILIDGTEFAEGSFVIE
jgi:hypothetical protein